MSEYIPTKIMHVTNECRYCGEVMFPAFNFSNGVFYFKCPRCQSQSAACRFDHSFIKDDELAKSIDNSLLGLDLDFEFLEEEDIKADEEKKMDAIKAAHSSILDLYNEFRKHVMNQYNNEDNSNQ